MKVLIIEDEKIAADKLERLLMEIDPSMAILGKLDAVQSAVRYLKDNTPDLIFLDIQLSDGIGFQIFDRVKINVPIIITTAFDQYAIKAFKLNSIGYLLKPIRKTELQECLAKYSELKRSEQIDYQLLYEHLRKNTPEYKQRFLVYLGDKILKIDVSDIAYFYIYEKGVYLKTFQNKAYAIDFSLEKLSEILDPKLFFRINRKLIVHVDAISQMTSYSRGRALCVLNPKPDFDLDCLVSVERSSEFKKWLNR